MEMRPSPSLQHSDGRRVHGLQQLSKVQIREAEDHRRAVSELHGRCGGGAAFQARQDILRMQPLSGMRFRRMGQTPAGKMSGVRIELLNRKMAQGWTSGAMPERRVQV
jgi:hypothetical protein